MWCSVRYPFFRNFSDDTTPCLRTNERKRKKDCVKKDSNTQPLYNEAGALPLCYDRNMKLLFVFPETMKSSPLSSSLSSPSLTPSSTLLLDKEAPEYMREISITTGYRQNLSYKACVSR